MDRDGRDGVAQNFLGKILPAHGYYCAAIKKRTGFIDIFKESIESLWEALRDADRSGYDAYFCTATFKDNSNRKKENIAEIQCFSIDLDYGKEGHQGAGYDAFEAAFAALRKFRDDLGLPSPFVVKSGGGFHAHWPLKEPLTRAQWEPYARGLAAACRAHGLHCDHGLTVNAAHILRPPGTSNRKLKTPRPVELGVRSVEPADIESFEQFRQFATPGRELAPLPPKPPYLPNYEPSDAFPERYELVPIDALAAGCGVVAAFVESGDQPEPLWMRMANLYHYVEDGERLFHEHSQNGYAKYDRREAQNKYNRAACLTGPPRCSGFRDECGERTRAICLACPKLGAVATPISLAAGVDAELFEARVSAAGKKPGVAQQSSVRQWDRTERGLRPKSLQNARRAIDELRITGRYNVFHNKKLIAGDLPENASGELSDAIVRRVRELIYDRLEYEPGEDNVRSALEALCEKNRFDPVCDYFDGLVWDGIYRIDRLFSDYFGAENTLLNQAFSRKTMLAAVRRARKPGCKFDTMPVLEGRQGSGKSTGIRILAGDANFSDEPIRWDDHRQQQEAVRGVLIHEISEMVGLRKADVESIKSFLSRQSDKCRPAYGRYVEDRPRRCIFIGTTNNDEGLGYLADPSGGRRFWPVETEQIDLEALKRDRDQLWAEAAALEARGEPLELDPALYEAAAIEQKKRFAHEPWTELLRDVAGERVTGFERVSTRKLLEVHLRLDAAQIGRREYQKLAVAMTALGWSGPKDLRIPSEAVGTVKGYERPVNVQSDTG
jgi:hypothetical protein